MSFDQPIGAPFTLASLSKPISSSSNGRVHAAGVCSASGAKKRKRTEIAVGVDGEGVSIYSVCIVMSQYATITQTFVASKSPTSNFVCAAAERYLHNRPVLHLSQRPTPDTDASLHICFPSWLFAC